MSEGVAKEELKCIHDLSYGNNDLSLYKCLQRQGYYRPGMAKDDARIQRGCPKLQESLDVDWSLFVQEVEDWKQLYLDLLQHHLLQSHRPDAIIIQKKLSRFFVEDDLLSIHRGKVLIVFSYLFTRIQI